MKKNTHTHTYTSFYLLNLMFLFLRIKKGMSGIEDDDLNNIEAEDRTIEFIF